MKDHHEIYRDVDPISFYAGAIEAFSEMVSRDLKPLALSAPLSKDLLPEVLVFALQSIEKFGIEFETESDFPTTGLAPEESTKDKTVILLYKNKTVLNAYRSLKARYYDGEDITEELKLLLGYPS